MAAVFKFSESNGAGEVVGDITGGSINFGNADTHSDTLVPSGNPITAGNNSYEKWLQGHWTGTFTSITNTLFYKSAGTALVTSRVMNGGTDLIANYTTPVATASAVATSDMETHDDVGSALAPNPPGAGGGTSGDANYSDYVVLQLTTTGAASPGAIPTQTYTMQWDET